MSRFVVNRRNGQLLRRASRIKIEEYFVTRPPAWRASKWLNGNNRYRLRCTTRFEKDLRHHPPTVNVDHLIKYVAASAPTHAIDGWSSLGRAVESVIRGDVYSAIHFGYYAELRGAMALLGAEGIAIFSRRHAVLDQAGFVRPFPFSARPNRPATVGTHAVIWPVLHYWAGLPSAVELVNDLIRPNLIPISTWLDVLGIAVPLQAVARQWLSVWGLDLAAAESDHDLRNLASYRPSEFRKPALGSVDEAIDFLEQLWQLFEPSPARRFANLERLLLRQVIRRSHPLPVRVADLQKLGMTTIEAQNWSAYLAAANDPLPFELASDTSRIEQPTCCLRVIARAALLLFVATAAVRRLLISAGFTAEDLAFWWEVHGEERCIWQTGAAPADPLDIWQDIAQVIGDSATWRTQNPGGSLRSWRSAQSRELLGAFELVAIWGLVP